MEPNRYDYTFGALDESGVPADPFELLRLWLETATKHNIVEPTAMCVSTVSDEGAPSSRIVLLRSLDEGLVFFTNYESRKGKDLLANPNACANFWWGAVERQVRIEGVVERVSEAESEAYFNSRPLESRAASAASPQSQVIPSREALEEEVARLALTKVARPEHWGGYRLNPQMFEFWQGRKARLHDRIRYRLAGGTWIIERIAP